MTTWDALLKGRAAMPTLRDSAHMMNCVQTVKAKYPSAKVVTVKDGWKLIDGASELSHVHTSHYACWAEAAKIMAVLK